MDTNLTPKLALSFKDRPDQFPNRLAEKFPRILRKLEVLWGSREGLAYLEDLVFPKRQDRQGFPADIVSELVTLKQVHDLEFPDVGRNPYDPFMQIVVGLDRVPTETVEAPEEEGEEAGEAVAPVPAAVDAATLLAHVSPVATPWFEVGSIDELRAVVDDRHDGRLSSIQNRRRLGDLLIEKGLLSPRDLEVALHVQEGQPQPHEPLGTLLRHMGAISEETLVRALCCQTGVIMVDLHRFAVAAETMKRVPPAIAKTKRAVPVGVVSGTLFVAVDDPLNCPDREFFAFLTNLNVELVFAARNKLLHRLATYGQAKTAKEADEEFRSLAKKAFVTLPTVDRSDGDGSTQEISENDSTVVGLVNKMIQDAIDGEASDIHLEAFANTGVTQIRFRRDGRLEVYSEFPFAYHEAVVSRIKIMADLDISERRHAQDGKIVFARNGHPRMDLRVSTIPTVRGLEFVTIRLLAAGEPLPLEGLGMLAHDQEAFMQVLEKPYGLVLVCGPTGSGKTTTLHSALARLNTTDRKIWTAEDPIEIVQPHVCQVQVNPKIGWTFASALRSFLRADPDVIMIGEMRDQETARIALEASMTGHLVLSTLHTNSASETVARLLDLGVDPYNLSDALLAVLAQRLARRLCRKCAGSRELAPRELDELAGEYHFSATGRTPSYAERDAIISRWRETYGKEGVLTAGAPTGCADCDVTGYRGRVGLYELMTVTPPVRDLVRKQSSAFDFLQRMVADGTHTLKQDGIEKVLQGLTDMHQVRSACV